MTNLKTNTADIVRLPAIIHGRDLQLADIVRLDTETFGDAIVHRLEDDVVHLRRPYMSHEDFSMGGGSYGVDGKRRQHTSVITTIGLEDFAASRQTNFTLVRRGPVLK